MDKHKIQKIKDIDTKKVADSKLKTRIYSANEENLNQIRSKRAEVDDIQKNLHELTRAFDKFNSDLQSSSNKGFQKILTKTPEKAKCEVKENCAISQKTPPLNQNDVTDEICKINWNAIEGLVQKHINDLKQLSNFNKETRVLVRRLKKASESLTPRSARSDRRNSGRFLLPRSV